MPTKQTVKNLQSTYSACWKHILDMMISTEKILTEDQGQSKESKRAKSKQSITKVTYLSLTHNT
jgi:organic hydroperoxide reductase OsmC/OhrA